MTKFDMQCIEVNSNLKLYKALYVNTLSQATKSEASVFHRSKFSCLHMDLPEYHAH